MLVNPLPLDWKSVFLKQNPFPSTPPRSPKDTVWAGFAKLRQQISLVFEEAISTDRSQVVLNWGEYGSGKTHAATYFQLKENVLSAKKSLLRDVEIFISKLPVNRIKLTYYYIEVYWKLLNLNESAK